MSEFWYKADIIFACTFCGKTSSERMIASAPTDNPSGVAKKLQMQKYSCKHCGKRMAHGVQVEIGINRASAEDLRSIRSEGSS